MYIERDPKGSWDQKAHLLVSPTEAEKQVLASEKRYDRLTWLFILGAFASIGIVALLFALLGGDKQNGWHVTVLLIFMIGCPVVLMTLGVRFNSRVDNLLSAMEKEDRAFKLRWRYLPSYGDVGDALMNYVLFSGERAISSDHMRSIVKATDPYLFDQFLMVPRHVEILRKLSDARSDEERKAWRELLFDSLSLDALIAATQPEIERLRALEAEQTEIDKINRQAVVRAGLLRVRNYAEAAKP